MAGAQHLFDADIPVTGRLADLAPAGQGQRYAAIRPLLGHRIEPGAAVHQADPVIASQKIVAIARNPGKIPAEIRERVTVLEGDLFDAESVKRATNGASKRLNSRRGNDGLDGVGSRTSWSGAARD